MKIICNQNLLNKALSTVHKAVATKTTVPILKGILIETLNNQIRLVATDLELGIEKNIEATIIESGSIVLSAKLLSEIVRKLPNNEITIMVDEKNITTIKCMNSEFSISGQPAEEFPELPLIDQDNDVYKFNREVFRDMIRKTVFSSSVEDTRPILTGILLEMNSNKINMVALDGFRMALCQYETDLSVENKIIIPSKTLNEIYKILAEEDIEQISFSMTDKNILFNIAETKIISRLLEGEFIDYKQILPTDYSSLVKVSASELLKSIERASLLAKEGKNNLVKFNIMDKIMEISSNSEIGKVQDDLFIDLEGNDIEIGFNSKYFMDALKNIDDEYIYLQFTSNITPCIIKPFERKEYTYLILPVRITDDVY